MFSVYGVLGGWPVMRRFVAVLQNSMAWRVEWSLVLGLRNAGKL